MSEQKLGGHCYCGAVKFEIIGKSDWVGHCHCESCRRASGSVMTTFAGFEPDQVVFTGSMPNRYTTADGVTPISRRLSAAKSSSRAAITC